MKEQERHGSGSDNRRLLSVGEMVECFGANRHYWYEQVRAGRLPVVKTVERKFLIDRRDAERLIEQHKQVAAN